MFSRSSGVGVVAPGHPARGGMVHGLTPTGGLLTPQAQIRRGQQSGEHRQQHHRYPHLPASRVVPSRHRGRSGPQDGTPRVEGAHPAQLPQGSDGLSVISFRCHAAQVPRYTHSISPPQAPYDRVGSQRLGVGGVVRLRGSDHAGPASAASCTANPPTPPAPPVIRTVSSAPRRRRPTTAW
ncbi:conserved hypothetical protein [Streptomyces viridochromogenes DSM 40736]|uniref:Uncharacterized protein n=1 Tax=Streptomyces viridochromogenes (strain DSM 40736 / JCM 4977 / BCRC 1201 / Tue 494) TaxID=591159 RepID=D9X4G2_STRVT|nr:conserved hypothetical protein [Streptomyces viridochromogenes DSM 40736]